jgi:predicted MFS family arabinose efflux permease
MWRIRLFRSSSVAATRQPRNPNFGLLLTGSSVSLLGSRVTTIAYPLLVLAITGSPVVAGLACFAATAPSVLFYLPAGALVDRCQPRIALLICESVRGGIIAVVVIVLLVSHPSLLLLILAAGAEEILEVFSTLAERRLARSLVDPENAASALAQAEARTHMAVMVGRPLGALLFGAAHALPFIADCFSFCVSVGTLLPIKTSPEKGSVERPPRERLTHEIAEGFEWLRDHRFAGRALLLTAGITLIGQALIMIFLGEAHASRSPAFTIGLVLAGSGVGGALGSALAPWLFRHRGYSLFKTQLTAWMLTFSCLVLPGLRSFAGVAAAMIFLGFAGAVGNIALDAYILKNARETILARVMSFNWLMTYVALALGPLLGGVLLKEFDPLGAVFALLPAAVLLRILAPPAPEPPEAAGYRPGEVPRPHSGAEPSGTGSAGTEMARQPVEHAAS